VRHSSGDHDDVARAQFDQVAVFAAEADADGPGGDAEHFMCRAVVVVVRIDAVDPASAPVITSKQPLARSRRTGAGFERRPVDDDRQRSIVWDVPVIGEPMLFDPQIEPCIGHSALLCKTAANISLTLLFAGHQSASWHSQH